MSGTLDSVESGKPYINRDNLSDTPPPNAEYRLGDSNQNCGGCAYFEDNACAVWNASVESNHVCNAYESDFDMNEQEYTLSELYFADGVNNDDAGENGIVKTILRTGQWRYSPDPITQKPIDKPLKVVVGHSTDPTKEIGLADIIDSFNANAIEHVTVPLSHQDKVHENTGYIKKLFVEPDPGDNSQHILRAHFDFKDPEIKGKIINGSIANTSAGLYFNYVRKDDGKKFPIALAHVALTNHPWINGMEPFGLTASEEPIKDVQTLELDTQSQGVTEPQQLWDSDESFSSIIESLNESLNTLSGGGYSPLFVLDIICDHQDQGNNVYKALIRNDSSDETFVASFATSDDGSVSLSSQDSWTPARQEWIDAQTSLGELFKPAEAPVDKKQPVILLRPRQMDGTNQVSVKFSELQECQRRRDLRLSQTSNNHIGTGGKSMSDVLEGLELAEDVRSELETALSAQEENKKLKEEAQRLRSEARTRSVEERVEELKGVGFSEQPGLLAYVRQVLLSDDEGTALLLSEDGEAGSKDSKLTASAIVNGFIDRMPKTDGKVNFGDQASNVLGDGDKRPDTDASKENKTALEDRAKDAREYLGIKE